MQKLEFKPHLPPCTKFNFRWIRYLNIGPDVLNLLDEKMGIMTQLTGIGKDLLIRMLLKRTTIDTCDLLKIKSFHLTKESAKGVRRQFTEWKGICQVCTRQRISV